MIQYKCKRISYVFRKRVGGRTHSFVFEGGVFVAKNTTAEKVTSLIEPELDKMGFELVDVELVKEGAYYYLRVYIDKENGVTINDCSNVSRILDEIIDKNGIINHDFFEVSSPGVERTLKREKDFEKYKGHDVCINLFKAKDGKKKYEGKLVGKKEDKIIIDNEGKLIEFECKEVSKVKTILKF